MVGGVGIGNRSASAGMHLLAYHSPLVNEIYML